MCQNLTKNLQRVILIAALFCFTTSAFCQSVVDTSAKPQPFAPGIVTTPFTEWATSFTPDGKTVPGNDAKIKLSIGDFFRLDKDGHIAESWETYDNLNLLTQMGVMPKSGS